MSVTRVTREIPSCLPDELNGTSLVEKMLEIQRDYTLREERPYVWFDRLECLSFHPTQEKVLRRAVRDPAEAYFSNTNYWDRDYELYESLKTDDGGSCDFVAVSYCFESGHESLAETTLNYEIHDSEGRFIKRFQTRDIVLQRVMKYAEAVGCRHFWIDQECFDQNDEVERQAAMDAMDLVYNRSHFPVALLETTLESVEVRLMIFLMAGCSNMRHSEVPAMVEMLRRVQQDKWWTRAWTLHEEYLAGSRMKLLIRHNLKSGEYDYCRCSSLAIEGEMCIPAFEFRQEATKFLQRVQCERPTDIELQETCKHLLKTFGRWRPFADRTESDDGRAVSSTALEDFLHRDISESYDFLPIAANVYGYWVRLHSDQLAKSLSHSAGLCVLTMYILNGEMFQNGDNIPIPEAGVGLSEYLSSISLNRSRQIPGGGLEWSRYRQTSSPESNDNYRCLVPAPDCRCRLPEVRLSKEGVVTSGYLWQIHAKIATSGWKPIRFAASRYGSKAYQRNGLSRLYKELQRLGRWDRLRLQIRQYLDEYIRWDERAHDDPIGEERCHMDAMALGVIEAIRTGRSLYLAILKGPHEGCAVFALDNKSDADIADGASVFTSLSWQHYVSMTVDVARASSESKSPLMTVTGWTYAFAFTWGVQQSEMILRWPKAWKWRNKRKLPGVDGDGVVNKSHRTR
jgi:hypothetical protein